MDELKEEEDAIRRFLERSQTQRIQLFTLVVTAFGALYGLAFSGKIMPDFLLFVPFVILILGLQIKFFDYSVSIVVKYVERTPSKFAQFAQEHKSKLMVIFFDVIPKWLLFIGLPMMLAMIYSYLYLNKIWLVTSFVPILGHQLLMWFFLLTMVFTFVYYVYVRQIRHNQVWKELTNKETRKRLFGW